MNSQTENLQLIIATKNEVIQLLGFSLMLIVILFVIVAILALIILFKYNLLQQENGKYIQVTYFKSWFKGDEVIVPTELSTSAESTTQKQSQS